MLGNYSYLKGTITKNLEDKVRGGHTHHNLIITAKNLEYQINIDTQSQPTANVKAYHLDKPSIPLLDHLNKRGEEGVFDLASLDNSYKLDYVRNNSIFPLSLLEKTKPLPWQEISNLLDEYIVCGSKVYALGEFYNDRTHNPATAHGLKLSEIHPHLPTQGLHQIHLNQGTPLAIEQNKYNGIYQDGGLFIRSVDNTTIHGFFFMFEEQSCVTDDTGYPTTQPS